MVPNDFGFFCIANYFETTSITINMPKHIFPKPYVGLFKNIYANSEILFL